MAGYLGIDIGASFVRSVVVRGGPKRASVLSFACVERAAGSSVVDIVRSCVAEATRATKGGFDEVAVSVSGARVTLHALTMPGAAKKQLSEVLRFELESHVPFEMSDAVFDWLVAKDGGEKGELELLTLTARAEDVREQIGIVKEALSVEPAIVSAGALPLSELSSLAIAVKDDELVAILDVGTRTTDVVVVRGGAPFFARTIGYGTEGMPGNAGPLVRDLRITFAALSGQAGATISRVVLCGGGARVAGAQRFFEGELGIPVVEFAIDESSALQLACAVPEHLPSFAKALGLACIHFSSRGFNLRRGALAYEGGFRWLRDQMPTLVSALAVLAVSFVFASTARLYALSSERHVVSGALGLVTKDVFGEEATSAARAGELLDKAMGGIDEDPMPHADAFDVIGSLSDIIPPSMKHDIEDLDVQKGRGTIHGIVGSIPDTEAIVTALKGERCISDPKIKSTSQVIGGDRQKYTLEFELKCPEDQKPAPKKSAAAAATAAAGTGGN